MSFLYPLGLLGLIGVPVLIIIYIIKNKYTEQTVASTYLWTLSERFLKRKNPINKIAGIISLILQILAVVFLSFGIAHPVFTLPGMANRYTIILDCSGSMRTEQSGSTRFDIAKDRITDLVTSTAEGSAYILICAGDATTVYDETTDKDRVLSVLNDASAGYASASLDTALTSAQSIFDENSSTITYLYTDKSYQSNNNVEVVNLSAGESNYALGNIQHSVEGGLEISGTVISYEDDATLNVRLTVYRGDDHDIETEELICARLEEEEFSFSFDYYTFDSFTVEIVQTDSQPLDNAVTVYNTVSENSYSTLVVSDDPIFIVSMLESTGYATADILSTEEYSVRYATDSASPSYPEGYGLYIYESFNPQVLPRDGTVWLFGLDTNLSDASFSVQNEVTLESYDSLTFARQTNTTLTSILEGVDTTGYRYNVKKYIKCSPYRNYTTIATCQSNPVIFATQTAYGNREVVFATTFGDSDMALNFNFLILFRNLLTYSFPSAVENTLYACGENAVVNIVGNPESIAVESPSGDVTYLSVSGVQSQFLLTEVGTYTLTVGNADSRREYRIFSMLPESESVITVTEYAFSLAGEQSHDGYDGVYDDLIILFVLLALVLIADWGVYCYEQYQLR